MPKLSEDWLAVLLGGVLLAICLGGVLTSADGSNPLAPFLSAPQSWVSSPAQAFAADPSRGVVGWPGIVGVAVMTGLLFTGGVALSGAAVWPFARGFVGVFALATLAYVVSKQTTIDRYGFAYMLWAIVLGLLVANTVGAPAWMRPALRGELYTKVGLVLLGSKVLFGRLLELGPPGIAVAWVVTPVVLCTTYWFGRRVLRIESASLSMVVAADMSVCGVSAAIATAAACRAKKEELSMAIGLSMLFTAVMMVVMPVAVVALGLDASVGGAWIGGTIDSTGAVAAAGTALGETGLEVATAIKMIQNILVGVTAFGVATFWVTRVERDPAAAAALTASTAVTEIWRRFPKFILGFLGASIVFSLLYELHPEGKALVESTVKGSTNTLRNWCFCLAFTAIGLETDFRKLAHVLKGGKPLVLYVCGQSLNLLLTLGMATLMFGVLFPPDRPSEPPAAAKFPDQQALRDAGIDPGALFYSDHPRTWDQTAAESPAR